MREGFDAFAIRGVLEEHLADAGPVRGADLVREILSLGCPLQAMLGPQTPVETIISTGPGRPRAHAP